MQTIRFWTTLLVWCAAMTAWGRARIVPLVPKTTVLKNGLSVTRIQVPSPQLVAYYTVVRAGSRNEVESGLTGFAHFFEHVMFKGTPKRPAGTREALLAKLGVSENAYTSDDVTVYHLTGSTEHLATIVDVEADRFQHLQYAESEFQTEAKAVLGEYHKNASSPWLKLEEALLSAAFTTHPYRHTTLGFYDDIKAMPTHYEYSLEFFRRWYRPDNTQVFIVGDFDDQAALDLVQGAYGGWAKPNQAVATTIPREPPQAAARAARVQFPSRTLPRHGVYWRTPAASQTTIDSGIQHILADYLAGEISPLFQQLVLEDQLLESLHGDYADHRDPYLFGVIATLKEERHRTAVDGAIRSAVRALREGRVDSARVAAIASHLKYDVLMNLDTHTKVAEAIAHAAGVLGTPDALELIHQQIAQVRPADLVTFAQKYLTESNSTTLSFETSSGEAP